MPARSAGPTYETILNDLAAGLTGPIALEDLIQQVLARKPSSAKDPRQIVRERLSWMSPRPFVFLDAHTLLPTHLAMQGARFRLPLGRRGAEQGYIEIAWFDSYLALRRDQEPHFVDAEGNAIPAPRRSVSQKVNSPLGTYEHTIWFANLSDWLRPQHVTRHDDLLVTVLDWYNGLVRLEVESHKKRDATLIKARDRLLADLLYALLENAADERISVHAAIPMAYARLPEKAGCPPHHWKIVLEQDDRFLCDDYEITYADGEPGLLDRLFLEETGQPLPRRLQPVTREQKKLVYRFKAAFKHKPRIWREVEILGSQTLADLNDLLVSAFQHDFDHLAGFWKFVPRHGEKIRYREVELGTVDPFGKGEGADVQIAAIGLKEGERLKYVFDFGDWIEHTLTLQAIYPAEAGVKYPREIARNKPRYRYCVECQANDKKTVARWRCLTCSNEQAQDLCYCDDCIEEHEAHYTVEIVY